MPINVWDYLREYDELRDEILATVDRVFRSGRLVLGQEGVKFEREMASYLGVAGGVGVNSGTDAIYIALASLGVGAGDEVITVPNTAVPTVSAIRTLGATPVFVDVHQGDRAGAPVRAVRGSRSADGDCRAARAEGDGRLRAIAGRALPKSPIRQR